MWTGEGADPGPQAGIHNEKAEQSQREAAFWHVADIMDLSDDAPRCELLFLDGKPVACMEFLGGSYDSLENLRESDHGKMIRVLEEYRDRGRIHQWAVLDAVLGNVDRHFGNVLIDEDGTVKLIDHGSTFAGKGFDPAGDKATFLPCYLRYRTPVIKDLHEMTPEDRMRKLELAPQDKRPMLRAWLDGIDEASLRVVIAGYGINPEPSIARLRDLKGSSEPVDVAVCRFWAET